MAFKIIVAFSVGIYLLAGTPVALSLRSGLQKDGKKEVNIHITMGCKESEVEHANFRAAACIDYLRRGNSKDGIYTLYDKTGKSYPAYCDLKFEPGSVWTLVMSWSTSHRRLPAFFTIPFKYNSPVNENAHNWNLYRLSLARMRSLQAQSTHWRATCSYPTHGIDFRDYLRGNFKDFNIFDFVGGGTCKKVDFINIRGHIGTHLTAPFWQTLNKWTLHTVNLRRQGLARSQVKTTLAGTGTASAPRETSPLPSGGSELIFNLLSDAKPAFLHDYSLYERSL